MTHQQAYYTFFYIMSLPRGLQFVNKHAMFNYYTRVSLQSSELGPPHPLPLKRISPHLGPREETHSLAGGGGVGDQIQCSPNSDNWTDTLYSI